MENPAPRQALRLVRLDIRPDLQKNTVYEEIAIWPLVSPGEKDAEDGLLLRYLRRME